MDKGVRAHHERRIKAKTLRAMLTSWMWFNAKPTPRQVGKMASKHMTCSCWVCRGDRQERIEQKLNAQAELREA